MEPRAYADEGGAVQEGVSAEEQGAAAGEGATADANGSSGTGGDAKGEDGTDAPEGSGQFQQELPLSGGTTGGQQGSGAPATAARPPQTTADDHVTGDMPLSDGPSAAKAGTIVVDGVKYVVNADGVTATVAGWHDASAPAGDLAIVAKVVSGADAYLVTSVADEAFKGCADLRTVALPDSLENMGKDAFAECPAFESFAVGERNEAFAAFDGMLFDAPLETLVRCPEGKRGTALLPDTAKTVSEGAFDGCAQLAVIEAGPDNQAFATVDNILYSKDRATLLHAPARTVAAALAVETKTVAAGSFAQCDGLASLLSLGAVETVEGGAFSFEAFANVTVALAAGADYDARKAVWERAGFSMFEEPADPGTVQSPAPGQGGFAFELLEDYTLAVSWSGGSGDPDANLAIPTSGQVNGVSYRVSAIAPGGFAGIERLTNVQIRAPITAVGDDAFAGCANLSSVTLEEGVSSLGAGAFAGTAVESVAIPASISFVGERAFSDCSALSRILTFSNAADVAPDVLAGCSGVSVYSPVASDEAYPWNIGLPAAGNHRCAYGLSFAPDPLVLAVGESADLFAGGTCEVPQGCDLAYSYPATPLSVDNGQATGKKPGTSEVSATLSLDGIELARATRTVEVREAAEMEEVAISESGEPKAEFLGFGSLPMREDAQVYQTVPLGTGRSFEQQVASGQILKFTVIEEDQASKTGRVEVSRSDDPANEPTGALVIPATVSESGMTYKVAAAAAKAFNEAWRVTSLSFEEGSELAAMYGNSFASMPSCRTIDIPHTTTTLDYGVFAYDTSLRFASIPDSVTTLGAQMFKQCTMLESVELGSGTRQLREETFSDCRSLTTIRVKGTVASIDAAAFLGVATEGVTVYVPSEASKAAWIAAASKAGYAFKEPIVQADTCTVTFDAQGGCPLQQKTTVGKGSLVAEPGVPSKEGKSLAGWFTDPGCQEATRWEFSNPVTADMTLYAKWIGEVRDGDLVYRMRPDGASLAVAAVDPAGFSGILAIEESHEFDGEILPVKEIAPLGFSASQVETVVVPGSVEVIGADAFRLSEKLRSVEFGRGGSLTLIASDAFRQCSALEGICIPSSVSKMGRNVFEKCTSLSAVEFEPGSSLSVLESSAFSQCSSLETIDLPDHFSAIGSSAFDRCTSLKTIELPKMLSYIGGSAFARCASLELIDLCTVETIGPYAFGESGLVSVTLPASVTYLGNKIFEKCPKLVHAVVEAPISSIPYDTFNASALTSISLPSTVKSIDAHAFRSCDSITTIYADGSLGDAGVAAAFGNAVKANATVILPAVSADGSETFETMKAAWLSYGFNKVVASSGALPTKDDPGNSDRSKASWSFADGTLTIEGSGTIADLGWTFDKEERLTQHWGPLRGAVEKIVVSDSLAGVDGSMSSWFQTMPSLVDISEARVLPGAENVRNLFLECSALKEVPEGFALPAEVQDVEGMFGGCGSLERVWEGFELPGPSDGCTGVTNATYLFLNDSSLRSVPFLLPDSLQEAKRMFDGCTSLVSLPEGFEIPESVTEAHKMFFNCPSLVRLPDSFDMPKKPTMYPQNIFQVEGGRLPMYYGGGKPNVVGYPWDQANRTLVTPDDRLDAAHAVDLNVKVAGESGPGAYWTTAYTDADGVLAEPGYAPSRPGMVFTLWYADEACTQRADFSQPFTGDTTLYGVLAPGTESGTLPTVDGTDSAFWSFDDAGTLYIRGAGTISIIGWGEESSASLREDHWGPHRADVVKVVMAPALHAARMSGWFAFMEKLADVSQIKIPSEVVTLRRTFQNCTALTVLPEGLSLPANLVDASCMFQGCSSLKSLPESFVLGDKVETIQNMFWACSSLASLPSDFRITDSVLHMSRAFAKCPSLTSLPRNFAISANVVPGSDEDAFFCEVEPDQPFVPTYYAGSDPSVLEFDWANQNRELIRITAGSTFEQQSADGTWFKYTVIEGSVNGLPAVSVAKIDNVAKTLKGDIVVPETVEFDGMTYAVASVAESGFANCDKITSVKLPATVTTVNKLAFDFNVSLTNLPEMPGVRVIGTNAFRGCTAMREAVLPETLTTLGALAFEFSALESVTIPASVSTINYAPFGQCSSLKQLVVDSGNANYCVRNGALCTTDGKTLIDASAAQAFAPNGFYAIPEGVENIGQCAFKRLLWIKGLALPRSCKSLGWQAIYNNENFEDLICLSDSVTMVSGSFAFPQAPRVQCTAGMVDVFKTKGGLVNVAPFATGAPATFALPHGLATTMEFASPLPADLPIGVQLLWNSVDSSVATIAPTTASTPDKYAFTVTPKGTAGQSCAAEANLVYTAGGTPVVLATSQMEISIANSHGALPTVSNPDNANEAVAGWSLDADGTLKVWSTEAIKDFEWTHDGEGFKNEHWGPVRNNVKSVDTTNVSDVYSMCCWFREMPKLSDIENFVIPENTKIVADVFTGDRALAAIPETFKFPDGATSVASCFNNCTSITTLPGTFKLPSNVVEVGALFGSNPHFTFESLPKGFFPETVQNLEAFFYKWTSLTSLPSDFKLPRDAKNINSLFRDCASLENLPSDFALPSKVESAVRSFYGCSSLKSVPGSLFKNASSLSSMLQMFYGCTSLEYLPDDLSIPDSATTARNMFNMCTSLKSIPAGFFGSAQLESANGTFSDCPSLVSLPEDFVMPTAKDSTSDLKNLFFVSPNYRVNGEKLPMHYGGSKDEVIKYNWGGIGRVLVRPQTGKPEVKAVTLNVKTVGEAGPGSYWTTAYTDAEGKLVEPTYAPSRPGHVFTLWYADEACTQRMDFSKLVADQAQADGSGAYVLYGKLAAGSRGGTLPTTDGVGSAFWTLDDNDALYIRGAGTIANFMWNNLNDLAKIESEHWGPYRDLIRSVHMSPSVDVSMGLGYWFYNCISLTDLSEFFVPKSASSLGGTFFQCSSLAALPESFAIPDWVTYLGSAFSKTGLRSLPASFRLPSAKPVDCTNLFLGCESLSSLPEGFALDIVVSDNADATSDITGMFAECPSLTSLPASFDLTSGAKIRRPVFPVDLQEGQPRVPTCYLGSNSAVLNYDWASDNRTLVTDPADRGMFEVTYKLVNEDGTWTTRTTALTDSDGMAADPGAPQHERYGFTGWCVDEDCLVPFDFSQPVDKATTLYGKHVKHGGRDTAVGQGQLPMVGEGEAWWRITVDGTLSILGEGEVADFGWYVENPQQEAEHWGFARDEVRKVEMSPSVETKSVSCWFLNMGNLEDISGFNFPSKTKTLLDTFRGCTSLEYLPAGLRLPDHATNLQGLFNLCSSIKSLPDGFRLGPDVKNTAWMLADTSIASLPQGFLLPNGVEKTKSMFINCSSLASLPEGFRFWDSINDATDMFRNCTSLASFPESLKLSDLSQAARSTINEAFYVKKGPLVTYYAGNIADLEVMGEGYWALQGREIVSDVPAGKAAVELYVPDPLTGEHSLWTRFLADTSQKLDEPVAHAREGSSFVGWYTEPECTNKATFPLTVAGDTSLYAKYATTSGALPTVDAPDNDDPQVAGWSLSNDGMLSISCQEGQAIADLGWTADTCGQGYWGPLRSEVKYVHMAETVSVGSMAFWFSGTSIENASGIFVPLEVTSTTGLFSDCGSLAAIPDGFVLPNGVEVADQMFLQCRSLKRLPLSFTLPESLVSVREMFNFCSFESLPAGFSLPKNVKDAHGMMANNTMLRSLPESFTLPDTVEYASSMFFGNENLRSLPSGFTIPASTIQASWMFANCSALMALPDKFTVPLDGKIKAVTGMFSNCSKLTALPENFDFPSSNVDGVWVDRVQMFRCTCGDASHRVETYYSGRSESVKALPWGDFHRTLVANSVDLPAGIHEVSFNTKIVGERAWSTYQTVLTDASGKVSDPLLSGKYGYAFDGWYTDPECTNKYDFNTGTFDINAELYGIYSLRVSYELPLKAKVKLDATGKTTPVDVQMRSFTPVPLKVADVSCDAANAASEIVSPSDIRDIAATILPEGAKRALPLGVGESGTLSSLVLPAAQPGVPGVLNYSIGLDIPDASVVKLWRDGWSTDLVLLKYTVEPAA